jgi:hypothetical protein
MTDVFIAVPVRRLLLPLGAPPARSPWSVSNEAWPHR